MGDRRIRSAVGSGPATVIAALVLLAAALAAGVWRWHHVCRFDNPVAWTYANGTLFVLERSHNRLLALGQTDDGLRLLHQRRIEPDDGSHYYMVRDLYPGPDGLVVESYAYDHATQQLTGYRFREYPAWNATPREIVRIALPGGETVPEFIYAAAPDGSHWFTHDWSAHPCLWRLPAAGGVQVDLAKPLPDAVQAAGPVNTGGQGWDSLLVTPDGNLAAVSRVDGRVVLFDPGGHQLRELGEIGFEPGRLLAAKDLSWSSWTTGDPPALTVASTANRSWVRFDADGRVTGTLSPLADGYPFPDIRTGAIYRDAAGIPRTFDLANRAAIRLAPTLSVSTGYRRGWLNSFGWPALLAAAAILVLLLGGGVRQRLAGWRPPLLAKLMAAFVPLLVAVALAVGTHSETMLRRELSSVRTHRSAELAQAVANSLDPADLAGIQQPADRTGEAYARIARTVGRIVDFQNQPDTPKWIVHKIHDHHYYFGISNWGGPVFEPFFVSNRPEHRIYRDALSTGKPQHGRTEDDQGQWFSYLHPLTFAPASSPSYVIELYEPTEALDRVEAAARGRTWWLAALAALAGALLAWLFTLGLTRPLRRLAVDAQLAEAGGIDHPLGVHSLDEVDMLAAALDAVRRQRHRAEELLHVVIPIGSEMARADAFDQLLETILVQAMRLCAADGGAVYLVRQESASLDCMLLRVPGARLAGQGTVPPLPLTGETFPAVTARTGSPANSRDLPAGRTALPDHLAAVAPDFAPATWLSLPLKQTDGEVIGVIGLFDARDDGDVVPFDAGRQEMAEALAVLAGAALAAYLREAGLRRQIDELHIAIDELKRDRDVADIVDSDYFQSLLSQADDLRRELNGP